MKRVLCCLLLVACSKQGKGKAHVEHEANNLAASAFAFDGVRLGDPLARVQAKPAFAMPCDIDPIEDGKASLVVYAAASCRSTFAQGTSVILWTDPPPGEQAVRVLAFLGGDYMSAHSSFPVHVGASEEETFAALGPPSASFQFEGDTWRLIVHKHPHNLYSVVDRGVTVGYVVGEMPGEDKSPRWRDLAKIYVKNTPVPAEVRKVAADRPSCESAVAHTIDLYSKDPALADSMVTLKKRVPVEVEACVGRGTKHRVACLLAANDTKSMGACDP
jgi:hypothetical protein